MADMIRGVCPQCGKKLEIPAELEEFSCLYCGARMRTEALRAKPMEERAVEALLAQLPGLHHALSGPAPAHRQKGLFPDVRAV